MNNQSVDLFGGTGFIGTNYHNMYSDDTHVHDRNDNIPIAKDVLYMISTTHNYHVFDDIHKDVDTNLTKLLNVLTNCKNKDIVFNFVSSWFVYGDTGLPAREKSVCNPQGFYSITKKCAEDLIISYCNTFDIKYRILRLCNVYGPMDGGVSKQKNALQYLLKEVQAGNNVNLYHGGNFKRDYMHVSDICSAINLCIKNAKINDIINIGSGIPQNFRDIIEFAITYTKSGSTIIPIEPTNFHKLVQVKDMWLDVTKLKNLGFSQKIDMYSGVRQLL